MNHSKNSKKFRRGVIPHLKDIDEIEEDVSNPYSPHPRAFTLEHISVSEKRLYYDKLNRANNEIHTTSPQKLLWDMFVGLCIIYSAYTIPYRIAFDVPLSPFWAGFDIAIDIIFVVDMIISFISTYEEDGVVIRDERRIAMNYLKTWFTVDFISTLPFDRIVPLLVANMSSTSLRSIKLVRILKIFRLLKILRLVRIHRKMKLARANGVLSDLMYRLCFIAMLTFFVSHILSCIYHLEAECDADEWSWDYCGGTTSLYSQYLVSIYWAVTTMFKVGYGDVVLVSDSGRLYSIFVIFVGSLIFGLVVAAISITIQQSTPLQTEKNLRMTEIGDYLSERKMKDALKKKIWKHFEYYYNHRSAFVQQNLFEGMTATLQSEIFFELQRELAVLVLFKTDVVLLSQLLPALKPMLAEAGQVIVHEGDYCCEMFFVIHGRVNEYMAIEDNDILVGIYTDGSDFGMVNAAQDVSEYWATFRATRMTDMLWLDFLSLDPHVREHEIFRRRCAEEMRLHSVFDASPENILHLEDGIKVFNRIIVYDCILPFGAFVSGESSVTLTESQQEVNKVYKVAKLLYRNEDGKYVYTVVRESSASMWKQWVINPHSTAKVFYDFYIAIFAIAAVIVLPYRIGFNIPQSWHWLIFDIISELLFLIDIVVNFFTAYERSDFSLNINHKFIALKYLKGWFWIDLASALPLSFFDGDDRMKLVRLAKVLRLFRFARVLRVMKVTRIIKFLKYSGKKKNFLFMRPFSKVEETILRVVRIVLFVGLFAHLVACAWSKMSIDRQGNATWDNISSVNADDTSRRYIDSLYWTAATIFTVGYGDIVAKNDEERLFSIAVILVGSLVVGHTISLVHQQQKLSLTNWQQPLNRLDMVKDYMAEQSLPKSLRDHILHHFAYAIRTRTVYPEISIWNSIPFTERVAVATAAHPYFIKMFPKLFADMKPSVIMLLLSYIEPCHADIGTFVYTFETGSGGLYFILDGSAKVVDETDSGEELVVGTLQSGCVMGQECMFPYPLDYLGIEATETLSMYILSKESINKLKHDHFEITEMLLPILAGGDDAVNTLHSHGLTKASSLVARQSQPIYESNANTNLISDLLEWVVDDVDEFDFMSQRAAIENSGRSNVPDPAVRQAFEDLNAKSSFKVAPIDISKASPSLRLTSSGRVRYLAHRRIRLKRSSKENSYNSSRSKVSDFASLRVNL